MMSIRLTTKRQATLPKRLCEEMRLAPGDALVVDQRIIDGEKLWIIKPAADTKTPWFACLSRHAKGKSHDMRSIRKSVKEARRRGKL